MWRFLLTLERELDGLQSNCRRDSKRIGPLIAFVLSSIARNQETERQIQEDPNGFHPYSWGPWVFTPGGSLLLQIVRRLTPKAHLSEIGPRQTLVYSNKPTPTELSLPDVSDLIPDYLAQQRTFWDTLPPIDYRNPVLLAFKQLFTPVDLPHDSGLKLLLTETRDEDQLTISLAAFNEGGAQLCQSSIQTNPQEGFRTPSYDAASALSGTKPHALIPLSSKSLRFLSLLAPNKRYTLIRVAGPTTTRFSAKDGTPATQRPLAPLSKVPPEMLKPEEVDPDQFLLEDAVGGLCLSLQIPTHPLVAIIPDRLMASARLSVKDTGIDIDIFQSLLKSPRGYCEIVEHDGFEVLRPTHPLYDEPIQLDRRELGRFMRKAIPTGIVSLRDWSLYHHGIGLAADDSEVAQAYLDFFNDLEIKWPLGCDGPHQMLDVLGAIPDADWNSAGTGITIRATATPELSLSVARWAEKSYLLEPTGQSHPFGVFYGAKPKANDLLGHLTEALPDGITDRVFVTFQDDSEPAFAVVDPTHPNLAQVGAGATIEEFAPSYPKHVPVESIIVGISKIDRMYVIGERRTVVVEIPIGTEWRCFAMFSGTSGFDAKPVYYSDLPQSFHQYMFDGLVKAGHPSNSANTGG